MKPYYRFYYCDGYVAVEAEDGSFMLFNDVTFVDMIGKWFKAMPQ